MKYFSDITLSKLPWVLMGFSAFAFESSALFFQYGLDLEPCIMCIYQRVALWGIFIAAIIGSMYSHIQLARVAAYIMWGVGAVWGLLLAIEHYEIQNAAMPFLYSCDFVPNFPIWAPLHEWLPMLFAATGDCGDIDWQFLGYTMPQVMIVLFSIYVAVLSFIVVNRLYHHKSI